MTGGLAMDLGERRHRNLHLGDGGRQVAKAHRRADGDSRPFRPASDIFGDEVHACSSPFGQPDSVVCQSPLRRSIRIASRDRARFQSRHPKGGHRVSSRRRVSPNSTIRITRSGRRGGVNDCFRMEQKFNHGLQPIHAIKDQRLSAWQTE